VALGGAAVSCERGTPVIAGLWPRNLRDRSLLAPAWGDALRRRGGSILRAPAGLFGVWGLEFGVWGLGFGDWGLGFGVWDLVLWMLGFRVRGLGFGG